MPSLQAHAVRRHCRDGFGDELHVRLGERRVPLVRQHDPLAADLVARRHGGAQLLVCDRLVDLPDGARAKRPHRPALACHPQRAELHQRERRHAVEPLHDGKTLEQPLAALAVGEVHLRDGPARRALVDVELLDQRLDRRHGLDRAAARADDGHPLAREVHVVAPLRGVKCGPGEALKTRYRRHLRHRQLPARRHQHVGLVGAGAGVQQPGAALLIPSRARDLGAQANRLEHPVAPGDVLDVGLDLGLRCEPARPPRVRLKRELVQVRRHVTGRAGIGVVVPHTADSLAPLEDRDVVVARAAKHDRGTDAAEAGAHHRDRPTPALAAVAPVRPRTRTHRTCRLLRRRARRPARHVVLLGQLRRASRPRTPLFPPFVGHVGVNGHLPSVSSVSGMRPPRRGSRSSIQPARPTSPL